MRKLALLDSTQMRLPRSLAFRYEEKNKELCQLKRHGGIDENRFHAVGRAKTFMVCLIFIYTL